MSPKTEVMFTVNSVRHARNAPLCYRLIYHCSNLVLPDDSQVEKLLVVSSRDTGLCGKWSDGTKESKKKKCLE